MISTRPLPKSSTNCQVSDPRVPRRSFLIARTTERMISLIAKSFHRTSTTKLKTRSLHDKKLRRGLQLLLVPQLPQPRPSDGGTPPRSSARERVLARYSKGPRARKMASARTPIAATKVAAPARSGGRPRTTAAKPAAAGAAHRASAIRSLPWQAVRRSRKSPLHARALAQIMSAPPFPGTSASAASKSATGNSTPRSRRLTSHSQGARNEGRRNRSSALGKAFRSGGTESSNPASSSSQSVSAVNPEAIGEKPRTLAAVCGVAGDVRRDAQAANRDSFALSL